MARITIEDCLDNENNRFSLVRLASRRAKQLLAGAKAVTDTKGNRPVVSALREIAAGKVKFLPALSDTSADIEEDRSFEEENLS
jgi:DNA-directed RNA polymerase subunit omega